MKRSLSVLCLGFILLAAGCGRNTPEAVALQYIEAMRTGDTELFRSLLSPADLRMVDGETGSLLLEMVLRKASREIGDLTYVEVIDTRATDKLATVLISCDGEPIEVNLIRVNGDWKLLNE